MKRTIAFFDEHGIFIDTSLLSLRVEFLYDLNLTKDDEIVLGGDNTDCYSISDFTKPDKAEWDMRIEGDQFADVCRLYRRTAKESSIIWVKGNHELRYEKDMCNERLATYKNVRGMSFDEIYGVRENRIDTRELHYEVTNDFIITHGEYGGEYPARSELAKWNISGMSGHSHKTDYAKKLGYKGRLEWFSMGHLADKSMIDMSCRYSSKMKWDRSFALIISDGKKIVDVEIIRCDGNGFYCKYLQKQYGNV